MLPSNESDFGNLIIKKFNKFLECIEKEIQYAKRNGKTENEFYQETRRLLKSINTFDKHLGDLLMFWEIHKGMFWSWVSTCDYAQTRGKIIRLINQKIGEFAKICKDHVVEFSDDEQKFSSELYKLIKKSRNENTIKHKANDGDLLILADCFIYKSKRYLDGFMYLITDDNELYGMTEEIIKQPQLLFAELKPTEKFVGFEPLRPAKFINDFKSKSASK